MRFTTVEEFEKWQAYFVRRKSEIEKSDYYLAAIAQSVYRTMGGAKTKLDDHLIKFEPPQKVVVSEAEAADAILAIFGVKPE
jgi:hypothetical protein